jgi:hypothetical protein
MRVPPDCGRYTPGARSRQREYPEIVAMELFFRELRVCLNGCFQFSLGARVMNGDKNTPLRKHPSHALTEWSNWKRRCFVTLLCLLELAMISAIVYGFAVLWN